jgi:zinc/manganese transport system ATP-binding protein
VSTPAIRLAGLEAGYGSRSLLGPLDLEVASGEIIAVLGPNGSGKTTLLKVLLGILEPMAGTVEIDGLSPRQARATVGYVPQHRDFDRDLPVRGRELVGLGLSGHRLGLPWVGRRERAAVDAALRAVGAEGYADAPVGMLSGGEQQRLRIAQALLGEPSVFLCDEPLLALDPGRQADVVALFEEQRREREAAVLFVTHEINPILPFVDRILYLVGGRAAVGTPSEVLTTARLSELYGAPVEVIEVGGRILVVAGDDSASQLLGHHHEHDHEDVPWG